MIRTILALVGGILAGFCLVMLGEFVLAFVYPPPANLNTNDPQAMADYMATMPDSAFLLVLLSQIGGAFGGGFVAALIAKRGKILHAAVVGVISLLAGVVNLLMLPKHPLWFMIADSLLYIPAACAGGFLAVQLAGAKPSKPKRNPLEISYEIPDDKGGQGDTAIKTEQNQLKIYSEPPPPS
jgi:hypothetical protein